MIIGLDLSLNSTGMAVITNQNKEYTNTITTNNKGINKIIEIKKRIINIIKKYEEEEIIIGIEGYGYNTVYAHKIGELGGVVKTALIEEFPGCKIVIIPPAVVKKYITGSGNAKKEQMLLKLFIKFGKQFKNSDEADAYSIAKFVEMLEKPIKTKKEKEFEKKIEIIYNGNCNN